MEDLTLIKLREAFSVAQKKFEIVDARYKKAIAGLYMPRMLDTGEQSYRNVADYITNERGKICYYATEFADEFGTVRGGRFYKKDTACYMLRDLERQHAQATRLRDMFKIVCNKAGIQLEI